MICLPISANWKGDSYDLILIIIDGLTKMIYYKPIKVMIDVPALAKMMIDMIVFHHGVLKSIVMDQDSLFISKF